MGHISWLPYEILDKTEKTENVYKIVVLGDGFAGKTAITVQFCENQFHDEYTMTIGLNFGTKKFRYKGRTYTLQIWDIAGQERFNAFRAKYYSAALAVILVYDVTNRLTFLDLPNWVHEYQHVVGPQPIVLAGNKIDLPSSGSIDPRTGDPHLREVTYKEGRSFADSINATFLETSAKGNYNIDNLFTLVVDSVNGDIKSYMLLLGSFKSVEIGFNLMVKLILQGNARSIYNGLIKLKQSIFKVNPYSVVLGNLSEWIRYMPGAELNNQVKTNLLLSLDAWKYYYQQSVKEGEAVRSKV